MNNFNRNNTFSNKLDKNTFKDAIKDMVSEWNKIKSKKPNFINNNTTNKINNTNTNKINNKINNKVNLKKVLNITKKIFLFIKRQPILTSVIIISIITLSNIGIINQTFLLKNINSLKANIVEIQTEKANTNVVYNSKIAKLQKQIEQIKTAQNKYNKDIDIKLIDNKSKLKANINKLSLLSNNN